MQFSWPHWFVLAEVSLFNLQYVVQDFLVLSPTALGVKIGVKTFNLELKQDCGLKCTRMFL